MVEITLFSKLFFLGIALAIILALLVFIIAKYKKAYVLNQRELWSLRAENFLLENRISPFEQQKNHANYASYPINFCPMCGRNLKED